jgi:hypothetical protein
VSMTTVCNVDAFERAVADARERLSAREGSNVSWRELVRRAGYDDSEFGRVAYHLLPRDRKRNGHHVPGWLIDALAPVLPISRGDLVRAAAEAAGYDVGEVAEPRTADDVVTMVTRYLADEQMTQAERDRVASEVLAAVSRAMQRDRQQPKSDGDA